MNGELPKGLAFEAEVAAVLEALRGEHPSHVRTFRQLRLTLNDGSEVVPDFELQFDLEFEEGRYLIECQDRQRSSPTIAHKIRHIKSQSSRNRFIFVYASAVPDAMRRILDADGVLTLSFDEFVAFIARLELQLRKQRGPDQIPQRVKEAVDKLLEQGSDGSTARDNGPSVAQIRDLISREDSAASRYLSAITSLFKKNRNISVLRVPKA